MFLLLLAAIVIVSLLALRDGQLSSKLCFNPYHVKQNGQWYRFLSHVFVHGSLGHLFINVFVFYSFGSYVVEAFSVIKGGVTGSILFYVMLIGAAVISSAKAYAKHQNDPGYNAVGASGVVSAVVFSFILINPLNSLYLFFIPIPIPAFIFGILYLVYEYYMDKKSNDHVAHDAHFFGAVFGILFTLFLEFSLLPRFVNQVISFF